MSSTAPHPEQREAAFFTAIRGWGITRGRNGVLGGVAQGVGERIGLARVPARLILVAAGVLLFGVVMVAYAAAWALLPDKAGNIVIQNFGRGITNVGALIGIVILALIGFFNLNDGLFANSFNSGWSRPDVSGLGRYDHVFTIIFSLLAVGLSLLVLGAIIFAIIYLVRRGNRNSATRPASPTANTTGPTSPEPTDPMPTDFAASHAGETADPGAAADVPSSAPAEHASTPDTAKLPPVAQTPGRPETWEAAVMPGDVALAAVASGSMSSGGPYYGDQGHTHASATPPRPPRPPRLALRRVPGPGRAFYLITAAWVLISIAIIIATVRLDRLAVTPGLAWFALFTVGFGVILAAIAVAGRKLGFLGFLSVPLLIVGLLTAVNSGELRDAYDSATAALNPGNGSIEYWAGGTHYDGNGNVIDENGNVIGPSPVPVDPMVVDPTLAFADDYQQILIAPQCYDRTLMQPDEWAYSGGFSGEDSDGSSRARLTYPELTANTTVDITAARTMLTIPEGTNLILRADSNAQSSIDWESRGLYCEFWDGDQDNMTLVNPGAPTLTLLVHDDMNANTIEIHEVPAVQTPSTQATASPQPTASPEPTSATDATNSTNEEVQS